MKRTLSLILALMLVFPLAACAPASEPGTSAEPTSAPSAEQTPEPEAPPETTDEEIHKAISLGLVPEEIQGDYDAPVTYAAFCSVLDSFVSLMYPKQLADWRALSAGYSEAADEMSRMEGMLVFLYAAKCVGLDTEGYGNHPFLEDNAPEGMDFWNGIGDYPLLPNAYEPYESESLVDSDYAWVNGQDYTNAAGWFASRYSYGNGNTYFDYDENYMLNFGNTLTIGDAIRAVERLYETACFVTYTAADAVNCGVTDEAIAQVGDMPTPTYDDLPDWNGQIMAFDPVGFGLGRKYRLEEVQVIAEAGYNFTRVPLQFERLFDGSDTCRVCAAYLAALDELVNWCAEYGIHVCFDLHDMPGYTTNGDDSDDDLFVNEDAQRLFTEFWRFMASHYKNVPTSLVSFNLLNEPHGSADYELTDELYSSVMLQAIDAIRSVSPDRLIIAGTLGVNLGAPVRSLVDAKVAQGFSGYIMPYCETEWPFYFINQCFNASAGDIVLKGDFPAGTQLILSPYSFINANYRIAADGNELCSLTVDAERNDGSGCTVASGECDVDWSWRGNYACTATLSSDAKEIRVQETEYGYAELLSIRLILPTAALTFYGDVNRVGNPDPPVLTVAENGTVTAKNPETLVLADRDYIMELLKPFADFRAETGVDFIILESGCPDTANSAAACAFTEDFLSVSDEYDVSWCCWDNQYSPIIHRQIAERRFLFNGEQWLREGGDYEPVSENYLADKELLKVYQRHMD